jgi:type III secretion protein V
MQSRKVIEKLLEAASSRRDLVIVLLLVTAICAMILPITPLVADVLIAVNIGISVLLLMVAFYVHSPVDFAGLPSIILITTVFRLSISIAATRLILIDADGGRIIQTFGDFVLSGNVMVGLVVFIIITIVQFVVITKGSERVAEVAARFSLDGLPGKQMSIDSDLRNGDIDQAEARRRRQNLERESQLYGAMDGAMKFVKGDAIAGIIIIAVNLFGGIAAGMVQRGLSFTDSTHVFSLLTIGEGLIGQIPALFISLTAGTIVTRVTGGVSQNLGSDIISQIAAKPEAMRLAGAVLLGLSLVPGFPSAVFVLFAVALGGTGTLLLRGEQKRIAHQELVITPLAAPAVSALLPNLPATAVTVLVSPKLSAGLQGQDPLQKLVGIARSVANELGFATPSIGYRVDDQLSETRYVIELDMVPEIVREVSFDLVYAPAAEAEAIGKLGLRPAAVTAKCAQPVVVLGAEVSETLRAASIRFWSPSQLLEKDIHDLLHKNASNFVGLQETRRLLFSMEGEYKDLLREVQRVAPAQRIADVLRRLLEEGVAIRNMRLILEAILEWAPREQDTMVLTNHVRLALKRQICHRVADKDRVIQAVVIERQTEDALRKAAQEAAAKNQQMMDAELVAHFGDTFSAAIAGLGKDSSERVVLLVSAELRRLVWTMLSRAGLRCTVLSYQEIAPDFMVRTLTTIGPSGKNTYPPPPDDAGRAQRLFPEMAYRPDVT